VCKGRGVVVFGYVGASFHIRTAGKQSECMGFRGWAAQDGEVTWVVARGW
jgi:hypothetical protein